MEGCNCLPLIQGTINGVWTHGWICSIPLSDHYPRFVPRLLQASHQAPPSMRVWIWMGHRNWKELDTGFYIQPRSTSFETHKSTFRPFSWKEHGICFGWYLPKVTWKELRLPSLRHRPSLVPAAPHLTADWNAATAWISSMGANVDLSHGGSSNFSLFDRLTFNTLRAFNLVDLASHER